MGDLRWLLNTSEKMAFECVEGGFRLSQERLGGGGERERECWCRIDKGQK